MLKKSSKQVFKDCDKDKDGALDATEVREALAILGCQIHMIQNQERKKLHL